MFSHGNVQIYLQTLIRETRTIWSIEKTISEINRLEIQWTAIFSMYLQHPSPTMQLKSIIELIHRCW